MQECVLRPGWGDIDQFEVIRVEQPDRFSSTLHRHICPPMMTFHEELPNRRAIDETILQDLVFGTFNIYLEQVYSIVPQLVGDRR